MLPLRIFIILVATIVLPCNSTPDDIDDFNRISASLSLQNNDLKMKNEKYSRDVQFKSSPAAIPPYLAQFLQQGNNLFFKPQILLGSTLNDSPYEAGIIEEKENQTKEIGVSVNAVPIESDKIVEDKITKDNDKITKDTDSIIEIIEEKPNDKISEIPEAPILAPLNMPALPQVIIEEPEEIIVEEPESIVVEEPEKVIVEEPENVIGDQSAKPEEVPIEKEHSIVIPEPPALMPLNPPKGPLQIFVSKPVPHVPNCIPTIDKVGYAIAIPCFPNYAQPKYSDTVDFENVMKNKDFIRPSFPLPRIPLGVTYNRPVKTVMPFREDIVSTTRYLPSVTAAKIPLVQTNRRLLENGHRRLSQMLLEKIPLKQEKAEIFEEPLTSFSAYCAHSIVLQRIVPNMAENSESINAVPLLELPERLVHKFEV